MMLRDCPVPYTCPIIDSGIDYLQETIKIVTERFEEVRSANTSLRDWGNELLEIAEDLQVQVDRLADTVSDLESDCQALRDELKHLHAQLDRGVAMTISQ